jgi:hypothetical protein
MSLELRDCRAKVTIETDLVLDAESRALNLDKSEIVREVMHAWALNRIHASTVLHKLLCSEGLAGDHKGK